MSFGLIRVLFGFLRRENKPWLNREKQKNFLKNPEHNDSVFGDALPKIQGGFSIIRKNNNETKTSAHSTYRCQYHIVSEPKYKRKEVYGKLRKGNFNTLLLCDVWTLCLCSISEQKARTTYDNILRYCDDPDVIDPIRFLREREIVHYQRFGENLRLLTDKLDSKNFYAFNPSFDKKCFKKGK